MQVIVKSLLIVQFYKFLRKPRVRMIRYSKNIDIQYHDNLTVDIQI